MAEGYLDFLCSHCRQPIRVPAGAAGNRVACPRCTQTVTVPSPAAVAPPGAAPVGGPRTPGLAVASLVLGILGLLTSWFCCGPVLPLLAVIFGHVAHARVRRNPAAWTGGPVAVTGFVLGYIGLALWVVLGLLVGFAAVFARAVPRA